MSAASQASCPSAPAEPGALILGRFEGGRLAYLKQPLQVDGAFLEGARQAEMVPEQHFRFSSPCLKKGCAQWADGHCGVAAALSHHEVRPTAELELPPCVIRSSCRWFIQEGGAICGVCPAVATAQAEWIAVG